MHILMVPSFFFTKTTEDAEGLELGRMNVKQFLDGPLNLILVHAWVPVGCGHY